MDNKVIKVINKEHGAKVIEFFKQYCDAWKFMEDSIGDYYGIIDGKFGVWWIDEIKIANAEIIELPEEKSYPRVMLVSLDNYTWCKRVVFMEKCGIFLAWEKAETLEEAESITEPIRWKYAKEIEHIEVTLEEIAEWKRVSKEQIIIK